MITYSFGLLEGGSTMPYRGIVLPPIVVFFGNEASVPLAAPPLSLPPTLKQLFFPPRPNPGPRLLLSNSETSSASFS